MTVRIDRRAVVAGVAILGLLLASGSAAAATRSKGRKGDAASVRAAHRITKRASPARITGAKGRPPSRSARRQRQGAARVQHRAASLGAQRRAHGARATIRTSSRYVPAPEARRITTQPRREVLQLALRAYACGEAEGIIDRPLLTIIDYSLPSTEPRLWVLDVRSRRVLFNELVAHGRNTGEDLAVAFSNEASSRQSSLGFFRTADVYRGRHGESLRLWGLEPGFNDRAEERKIVMHGAWYVSATYAAENGQLGRSWGCPALELGVHQQIINRIKDGSAVFVYYPDQEWLSTSRFLHCDAQLAQR